MRSNGQSPEAVGTWLADWQFVPCDQYDHGKCANLMRSMGCKTIKTPKWTKGVDSYTMRDIAAARRTSAAPSLFNEPYAKERPECRGKEDVEGC